MRKWKGIESYHDTRLINVNYSTISSPTTPTRENHINYGNKQKGILLTL